MRQQRGMMRGSGWWAAGLVLCLAWPAYAGGTIAVSVQYSGTPPIPKPVNFGAEQQCALMHTGQPPLVEDVVVGAGGGLQWTLAYVKEGVTGTYTPPAQPAVVEQVGCVFKPHVAAVQAGQPVEFRNEDAVLHNVRALSKQAQSFNIAQPTKGMKAQRKLAKPEIGIPLKCDVHFWMVSYLHVLAHPFFGVSDASGAVTIQDVPAGTYTLEVWHEKLGAQAQSVTVQDGQTSAVTFTYAAK